MKTTLLILALALGISNISSAAENGGKPKTIKAISTWVTKNIEYPEASIENREEGTVYVSFTVENGIIKDISIVGGVSQNLDEEVLSTLSTIPVSELELDKSVNKSYILPVNFAIK